MPQHAGWERLRDRVQGHSALARFQGARSPLAEFEAAPQAAPGKAPAQKSATKLRCFARCERRGERRGATKGSIALQSRLTMIDRSREHCYNANPWCHNTPVGSACATGFRAFWPWRGSKGRGAPWRSLRRRLRLTRAKPLRKNPQQSCGALPGVSGAANAAERTKGLSRCNPG